MPIGGRPLEFDSAVAAARQATPDPQQRTPEQLQADPGLYALEDGGPLTKGQSDAVRVKFFNHQNVSASLFTPAQIQWGQTVNPWGFGHQASAPDVGELLGGQQQQHGDTLSAPQLSSGGFGSGDGSGIMAGLLGLLLLNSIKPPDPAPAPPAPAAVPASSAVASAATRLVNPSNTSGGIASTILTDPTTRARRRVGSNSSSSSNLVGSIFGTEIAPLGA